jgi:hypothetical protein
VTLIKLSLLGLVIILTLGEIVKLIFYNLGYINNLIVGGKLFKYIFLSRLFLYRYII